MCWSASCKRACITYLLSLNRKSSSHRYCMAAYNRWKQIYSLFCLYSYVAERSSAFKCNSTLQLHILFDSENYCARGTPPTPIAINFTLICLRHTRSAASVAQRQVLAIAVYAPQLMSVCLCWPLSAKRPHARLRKLLTLQIATSTRACKVKQQASTYPTQRGQRSL